MATAIEYGLIAALIAVVVITAIASLGTGSKPDAERCPDPSEIAHRLGLTVLCPPVQAQPGR